MHIVINKPTPETIKRIKLIKSIKKAPPSYWIAEPFDFILEGLGDPSAQR